MNQPLVQLQIERRRRMSRIYELDAKSEFLSVVQIFTSHLSPISTHCLRHACIAIARQIGEVEPLVYQEKIDALRTARRVRRAGQTLAKQERIYQ